MTGPMRNSVAPRSGVGADPAPDLVARIAATPADRQAALALRRSVFVDELGAAPGTCPDTRARTEQDRFDRHACHLILEDLHRPPGDRIVGTSRIVGGPEARAAGGYYAQTEFDIVPLIRSGLRLIEVGRTCLHREYRGGSAMVVLWRALAGVATARGADLLFGTASLPGTDVARHRAALDLLHRDHLAPPPLRVRSRQGGWDIRGAPEGGTDRLAPMRGTPALLKSYLRLGGMIGDGVFVDAAFNTTDVCLVLDVRRLTATAARLYGARADG